MRIKPLLGWLALFLFAATAEARSLGVFGRSSLPLGGAAGISPPAAALRTTPR